VARYISIRYPENAWENEGVLSLANDQGFCLLNAIS
jgi:hypothetical protein